MTKILNVMWQRRITEDGEGKKPGKRSFQVTALPVEPIVTSTKNLVEDLASEAANICPKFALLGSSCTIG